MDKDLLTSKTIWGAIVSMIALTATVAGYDIGNHDDWVNLAVGIVGGVLTIHGRIAATRAIGSVAGRSLIKKRAANTL